MRVKQTAKKITSTGEEVDDKSAHIDQENINNHSSDTVNNLSDNEVEFVVECRRDLDGNQFLLDGTLVIEPAPVAETPDQAEPKSKQNKMEKISFEQFVKDIQLPSLDKNLTNETNNHTSVKKLMFPYLNPQVSVKCTACNSKINPLVDTSVHKHPVLEVILCKVCIENQKDKYFVIDEDDCKETLCRWCVEGGSLICCDFCSKSYCKTCIKRNLGRTVLSEILNQEDSVQWKCFACDPTPIKSLQDSCSKIFSDINTLNESRRKSQLKSGKKPIPRLESVTKKRSISKAFPPEASAAPPSGASTAKVNTSVSKIVNATFQSSNPNVNTINLINNMEGFGTEWYLRNVNLEAILIGIDKIDSRSLIGAISSTKKCVEAFYSDIRNLENEINKAGSTTEIAAIVSMFKSVYRHHIFNRFCQVQSRIEEDKKLLFSPPPAMNGLSNRDSGQHSPPTPSLLINSVVSKAPSIPTTQLARKRVNNSFTPSLIAKGLRQLSNGDRKSVPVMYSIDLTDDSDKPETPSKLPPSPVKMIESILEPVDKPDRQTPKEVVVDLCNDDDSSSVPPYPSERVNINNQLFAERNS